MDNLSQFSQVFIPNTPINGLISGYDNNITASITSIIGNRNRINAPMVNIIGNDNFISKSAGSIHIVGIRNYTTGQFVSVVGNNNNTVGSNHNISGNDNVISGDSLTINGNSNIIKSNLIKPSSIFLSGNGNNISSATVSIIGYNNTVQNGVNNSFVFGNNNILQGKYIVEDISSFTNSAPTNSVAPYLSNSNGLYINGDYNVVGISVSNIHLMGDGCNVPDNTTNSFLFGNGLTASSNQFIISGDLQVNGTIKNTSVAEQYTPSSTTDPYGVQGQIVYDTMNGYIKTQNGWMKWALINF